MSLNYLLPNFYCIQNTYPFLPVEVINFAMKLIIALTVAISSLVIADPPTNYAPNKKLTDGKKEPVTIVAYG